jgi:hypothetical protein
MVLRKESGGRLYPLNRVMNEHMNATTCMINDLGFLNKSSCLCMHCINVNL